MQIAILGIGAMGSNICANLASDLRNDAEITVVDFDTVEERNVSAGTQFYMPDQVEQLKTEALQYNIYKWFGKEINILNEKVIGSCRSLFQHYNLIVDCFDNYDSRMAIQTSGEMEMPHNNCNLLHCGFSDQMTFEVCWAERYDVPEDRIGGRDICELQGASSFIKHAAGVASSAIVNYVHTNDKFDYIGNKFSTRKIT